VYIRNENATRILVADVYRAQQIRSSVDLKVGVVGIAMPLRAVVQSQFSCAFYPAPATIHVYPPKNVPQLVRFENNEGKGYLFSPFFTLPIHNVLSQSITVEFLLEKPVGEERDYFIRFAKQFEENSSIPVTCTIAPGQTMAVPLEIITSTNSKKDKDQPIDIACRENRPFTVIVTPSKGQPVKQTLQFECRHSHQSFLFSYLDHDDTVSQAAVILPLDYHSPHWKQRVIGRKGKMKNKQQVDHCASTDIACIDNPEYKEYFESMGYPVLLTLHGSGIAPLNHADAHKMMPNGMKEYVFGIEGYYVIAPSRFGAHNWEGVGDLTARVAVKALKSFVDQSKGLFPNVMAENGIMAGHSMGGHGAWVTATNAPDRFSCAFPMAGWIKKEEYSNGNLYFSLDIDTSFTDPNMKLLLEKSLSEYHVDRLIGNLQTNEMVHIRVGSHDATTHPWFSRRMYRLLKKLRINSTIEETMGKQHWWWDTNQPNDGGVVNDPTIRQVYTTCIKYAKKQKELSLHHAIYQNMTEGKEPPFDSFSTYLEKATKRDVQKTEKESEKPVVPFRPHKCHRNLTLSVINPALHEGLCGLQVLQQHQILTMSTISVTCTVVTIVKQNEYGEVLSTTNERICRVTTSNVRRAKFHFGFGSVLYEANKLFINNERIVLPDIAQTEFQYCFSRDGAPPAICEKDFESLGLSEKSLVNLGPIRRVYDRPFYIVYGTPPSQALRLAMRDFAVYLGNAHYASHNTYVQVLSDLEYRSGNYAKKSKLNNLLLIGDVFTNKLFRAITEAPSTAETMKSKVRATTIPVRGSIPSEITLHGYAAAEDEERAEGLETNAKTGFTLGKETYSGDDHGLMFTLPIINTNTNEVGMGVCIHANTVQGYMHLSRLSWPVIPPMVRAPFANYMPDFIVANYRIWAEGFGGVLAAGYWDTEWKLDQSQMFRSNNL
jgi:hypothetical protein